MKKIDLKKKTVTDLNKALAEDRASLREFRFALSGSRTKDLKKGKNLKRNIARTLTELNARVRLEVETK